MIKTVRFRLVFGARSGVIGLPDRDYLWPIAAVLQLFASMKPPLFGQKVGNNIQTR